MSLTYPARFMLAAAMNPCPCGYYGDPVHPCRCGPLDVERYRSRVSGPLLDRIDIHLEVPAVAYRDLVGAAVGGAQRCHPGAGRSGRARLQRERFRGQPGVHANAHMTARDLRRHCRLSEPVETLLRDAVSRLGLSARAYHRVLKIARTIADLDEAGELLPAHVNRSDPVSQSGPKEGRGVAGFESVDAVAGICIRVQPGTTPQVGAGGR